MNTDSLFSSQWHRVRDVSPKLAPDVDVARHVYRGRVSYLLNRRSTTSSHRLDVVGFELVDRLDGSTSIGQLWELAVVERGDNAPTQDELISLFYELWAAELIVIDKRVPAERQFERRQIHRSNQLRQKFLNPLYVRFALHDPDSWLNKLIPVSKCIFSKRVGLLWLLLLVWAVATAITHSSQLASDIRNMDLLSARNALLFALIYPPMKLIHELAHGLAVKRSGGFVHETGIALMVMLPLPYVDASASSLFPNKYDRMIVSSAGILVELAFAALGLLLWSSSHGTLQDVGLMMFLIGGISTLLLNGNPLLKFDGYYLLADLIEIPNLAERSKQALKSITRSLVTGSEYPTERGEGRRERCWLLSYGVLASIYRTLLLLSIAWMLSDRWFFIGVVLAAVAVMIAVIYPVVRIVTAFLKDPVYRSPRALGIIGLTPVILLAVGFFIPVPHSSFTQGVVWLPDDAVIRASNECEIIESYKQPGVPVSEGDTLFICDDPIAKTRQQELQARVDELEVKRAGAITRDPLARSALDAEIKASEVALSDAQFRVNETIQVAKANGRFDIVGTSALAGRSVNRGEIVGYIIPTSGRTVRVALPERLIGRVDEDLERVEVRIPGSNGSAKIYHANVIQRTPKATRTVASAALSTYGGGSHEADPRGDGRLLIDPVFDFELDWPEEEGSMPIGAHVGVRFVYTSSPLARRLQDSILTVFEGVEI